MTRHPFMSLADLQMIGDTLRLMKVTQIAERIDIDFGAQWNTQAQRARALKTYRMIFGSFGK